ncbi:hypothetical protein [Streptomyces sp. NPDC008092]|uniref:hypothetical protein n=1 Tax=Streptomyces sp. NPDC008092 TaxID=3364808 RepID=UPI0036E7A9E7
MSVTEAGIAGAAAGGLNALFWRLILGQIMPVWAFVLAALVPALLLTVLTAARARSTNHRKAA